MYVTRGYFSRKLSLFFLHYPREIVKLRIIMIYVSKKTDFTKIFYLSSKRYSFCVTVIVLLRIDTTSSACIHCHTIKSGN